jgi:pSer/pThr/pTyr-binding forkhead associated (FHA) protein
VITKGVATDRLTSEKEAVRIGRDQSMDIWLPDPTLSKHHATIQREGAAYVVHDHSTNGTWVNEERLTTPRVLNDGDVVRLGTYTLRFEQCVPQWMRLKSEQRPVGDAAAHAALGRTYALGERERETRERSAGVAAQLTFVGRAFPPVVVDRDVFLAGSGEGCHLKLKGLAPRVAAVLVRGPSGWQLVPVEDTTVADQVVTERLWLQDGDKISFGSTAVVFHAEAGLAKPTA